MTVTRKFLKKYSADIIGDIAFFANHSPKSSESSAYVWCVQW